MQERLYRHSHLHSIFGDILMKPPINLDEFYKSLSETNPGLKDGIVNCKICWRKEMVDSAHCLRYGWPKCCGQTMSLGK